MPKIIENLESKLAQEARKQVEASGYSAMTMRSVAQACGVGVGTVYNYFSSKEELLAKHLLENWKRCIEAALAVSLQSDSLRATVHCIYNQLISFARRHKPLFQDETAKSIFAVSLAKYHQLLRTQLAQPLRRFCSSDFTADFFAEALLTWTLAGKPFEELYGMLEKLI